MIGKRSTLWLLISGLALLLTGCVWLRLLAFKEQLADLDRYVKVDDRNGLAFHFLEPVLYADDVRELLQMEPTVKTTNQNCQTWLWTFEKELAVTNAEPANFDLTFATLFENRKFNELGIPERFTAVIPKPIILGIVRSLGHADIDRSKRSASVRCPQWRGRDQVLSTADGSTGASSAFPALARRGQPRLGRVSRGRHGCLSRA